MRPKELESLTEAVRVENRRRYAFEAQKRSVHHTILATPPITTFRGERPFVSQYSMRDLESTDGLDWTRIANKVTILIFQIFYPLSLTRLLLILPP